MEKRVQPSSSLRQRSPLLRCVCPRNVLLTAVAVALATLFNIHLSKTYAVCSTGSQAIYTADDHNHVVECILVKRDRIAGTGTYGEIMEQKSWYHRIKSIPRGSIVVPGLTDAHAHVLEYGFKMQLPLDGSKSISEVITRIESYVKSHPDVLKDKDVWIQGMGWDQTRWEGNQFPTARDLVTPLLDGRPVSLARIDGHANWVSPRVLQIINDTTGFPNHVEGGVILRDERGCPSGVFIDQAMGLIPHPSRTDSQRLDYFELTMQHAVSVGLTNIHDAGVNMEDIKFFKKQAKSGRLPIRLYLMATLPTDISIEPILPLGVYGEHSRLTLRSIKLFMDGALGSWGAALLEPYSDRLNSSGLIMYTAQEISDMVSQIWREGWQVNVHCIGDRANRMILDVYEEILGSPDASNDEVIKWRPRIEHAQIMSLDDLKRAGELGVITSVQPTHATSDMWYAEQRLGPERIKGAYAYKTLLDVSPTHHLPLGSDFPVEGINPLLGFYAAVSRLSVDGTSPNSTNGWYPSQRLTRLEALRGMTISPAYASFREQDLGSLELGKKADYVVLDHNIMDDGGDYSDILKSRVLATVVDGDIVYGRL